MKFPIVSLTTALIASLSFLTSAKAENVSFFTGGGYTVKIVGFGSSASYTGCDQKKRCLTIAEASHYSQGSYVWENADFSYSMSPVGDNGKYRLRIFDPNGKRLLNVVMDAK